MLVNMNTFAAKLTQIMIQRNKERIYVVRSCEMQHR